MKKYCPRCNRKYNDSQQRFCLDDGALLSLDLPEYRWLIGQTLDGKYRIDALVGVGGFGAVYSAHHLGLDRQVAYKILQPQVAQRSPEAVGLFEGEARTAAKLQHENIVTIHDAGRTMDDISYIAMEWLEGRPLDEELAASGQLSFDRTAEILRQVAAALAFAHAHRTVHRDLKPSNVMLIQRPGGVEQVKVVDFGIAKVLSSNAASTISRSIGTPAYASPEQWKRGGQIDGRADIYALGVMLFEMLTGKLPFNAGSVEELVRLKLAAPPPSLRFHLSAAPTALDDLLRAMMDIDPNRRPQKVGEVPALFEAARKPLPEVDPVLLQATTVAEATEKLRESEVQRYVEQPDKQPELEPPRKTLRESAPERPPEQKPIEPAKPKSEVVKVHPPPVTARFNSVRNRAGVIAVATALIAMLGYGAWSRLRGGNEAAQPSTGEPNSALPSLKAVIPLPPGVPLSALRSAPVTTATVDANGRVTRLQTGPIQFYQEDLGGGVKLEMVAVPGGRFQMGSPGSESGRDDDETQHWLPKGDWGRRRGLVRREMEGVLGGAKWAEGVR